MPGLADCLGKVAEHIISKDERNSILAKAKEYKAKGMPERDAEIKAVMDYHESVHEDLNKLKDTVKVPKSEYKPFDNTEQVKEITDKYEKLLSKEPIETKKRVIDAEAANAPESAKPFYEKRKALVDKYGKDIDDMIDELEKDKRLKVECPPGSKRKFSLRNLMKK